MTTTKEQEKDLVNKILDIDPRYLWIVLFILLAITIVRPLGFPLTISPYTKDLYDHIETLEPDSLVLCWNQMSWGFWPTEYRPGAVALVQHLIDNDIKFVFISWGAEGSLIFEQMHTELLDMKDYVYGEDYVDLGFYAGFETALAAFAKDVNGLVKEDYYGTPLSQLPIMEGVNDANAFDLVIDFSGTPAERILRQYHTAYDLPCGFVYISGMFPDAIPYYSSGQMIGFVNGLRGGAEYEILINKPRWGAASLDALSTSHIFYGILVIFVNILYVYNQFRGGNE
jgi:hypothetical protein